MDPGYDLEIVIDLGIVLLPREAYNLLGKMRELTVFTELEHRAQSIRDPVHPLVLQTDRQARLLILGIDCILRDIAGPTSEDVC